MHEKIILVYDKECPACDNYCQVLRIRKDIGELQLVDARDDSEAMADITARGFDIDEGMVLILDDQLYYGSDAIHALALISSRSGFFNRMNYHLFRSAKVSGFLYPVLRVCRNLLLKILGKTRINNLKLPGKDRF